MRMCVYVCVCVSHAGDPIEVNAALAVYTSPGPHTPHKPLDNRQPLFMTALKSQMGHAEPAAGKQGAMLP